MKQNMKICTAATLFLLLMFLFTVGVSATVDSEVIEISVSPYVLQEGGFPPALPDLPEKITRIDRPGAEIQAVTQTTRDKAEQMLVDAMKAWKTSVDLSSLHITTKEFVDGGMYFSILNDHPEFFYVTGSYSYHYNDSYVTTIEIRYNKQYTSSNVKKFNDVVSKILSGVEKSWNDEQKALYLHDYLVTHCEYDLTYSRYSAYNALVEGTSVCQGYSLAYLYLMKQVGVPCRYVSSSNLNHAWNLATVNGVDYYVDCTWDDPIMDSSSTWFNAYCGHGNLLKSQEGITQTGHRTTDWVSGGSTVYGKTGKSQKYDTYYWTGVGSAICLTGMDAYYDGGGDRSEKKMMKHSYKDGSDQLFSTLTTSPNENFWYSGYLFIQSSGDILLAAVLNDIFMVNAAGENAKIYTLTEAEKAKGIIYGAQIEGNRLRYDINSGYASSDFEQNGYINIPDNSVPVKTIQLESALSLYEIDTKTLGVEILPKNATAPYLIWSSSDPAVASVEDGIITCHSSGTTIITAKSFFGNVTASCTLTVEEYIYLNYLSASKNYYRISIGGSLIPEIKTDPADATIQTFTLSSEDPKIAEVSADGTVTGKVQGITKIKAKSNGITKWGYSPECEITVVVVRDESLLERDRLVILPDADSAVGREFTVDVLWGEMYGQYLDFDLENLEYDEDQLEFLGFEELHTGLVISENGVVTSEDSVLVRGGERLCSLRFRAKNSGESFVSIGMNYHNSYYNPAAIAAAHINIVAYIPGDVNNDDEVDSDDAIYLLRHTMNQERYPITQPGDMNRDDEIDTNDAIYLLRHTMNPDRYPLK